MINYFMEGFNYSEDGDGNRLVIHLQGCNLKCPWCSNPEGIEIKNKKLISEDDLVEKILSSKRLFFDGGGVTFTGGECLLQKDNLKYVFKRLKENDINIAIETNSTIKLDKEMYSYIDLLICDYKHYDKEKLHLITKSNTDEFEQIKDYILNCKRVRVRTVLINGFNNTTNDAINFVSKFKVLNIDNTEFEFLKYHEYGKSKYEKLNLEYSFHNGFVSEETRVEFETIYKENGLKVIRS